MERKTAIKHLCVCVCVCVCVYRSPSPPPSPSSFLSLTMTLPLSLLSLSLSVVFSPVCCCVKCKTDWALPPVRQTLQSEQSSMAASEVEKQIFLWEQRLSPQSCCIWLFHTSSSNWAHCDFYQVLVSLTARHRTDSWSSITKQLQSGHCRTWKEWTGYFYIKRIVWHFAH